VEARQHAGQERRRGHRRDREDERPLPAIAIADMADKHAAQGPHDVADREDAEGGKNLRHGIGLREERAADLDSEVAVDGEIIPFEQFADAAGDDDAQPQSTIDGRLRSWEGFEKGIVVAGSASCRRGSKRGTSP